MEKIYNKLVRDNIPNIIEANNETAITRLLREEEYRIELYRKLREECEELITSNSKDEIIKESADVLEVIKAILKLNGETLDTVIDEANDKRKKRGGFEKRIYLVKTIDK